MRKTIDILENHLRIWEDRGFIRSTMERIKDGTVPGGDFPNAVNAAYPESLRHWRDLREHLLQAQTGGTFDCGRFLGAPTMHEAFDRDGSLTFFNTFPCALWQWTATSRRVYQVDEDLQALLRVTSFHKELTGGDLKLPFPAFIILLAKPIVRRSDDGASVREYSGLFVFTIPKEIAGEPGADMLGILLLSSRLEGYAGLNSFDRDSIRKALHKGDHVKAARKIIHLEERLDSFTHDEQEGLILTELENLKDLQTNESEFRDDDLAMEVFRLVLGLTLYLQMLPSGSTHRSDWKKPPKSSRPDPRAITNEAEVCSVSSVHALTPAERERYFSVSVTTGRELSAHTREGYFRRRPGEGQNPAAPKIVWVRPTVVRRDRLAPGEVVGGATVK